MALCSLCPRFDWGQEEAESALSISPEPLHSLSPPEGQIWYWTPWNEQTDCLDGRASEVSQNHCNEHDIYGLEPGTSICGSSSQWIQMCWEKFALQC